MSELSNEMKLELIQEINRDGLRIAERAQAMDQWKNAASRTASFTSTDLEQLTYITEQIRLKLRLLGAPRIYQ